MAKKKFDIGSTNPLDGIGTQQSLSPTPSSSESDRVAKATGKRKQGDAKGRVPKSIRLPIDLIDHVNQIVAYERYGTMDFWHWLIEMGVAAYDSGERPQIVGEEIKRSINV